MAIQRERLSKEELENTNTPFILALSGPNIDLDAGKKRRDRLSALINKAEFSANELSREEVLEIMGMHFDILGFVKKSYGRPERTEDNRLKLSGLVEEDERGQYWFPGYSEITEKNPSFPRLLKNKWEDSYLFHMGRIMDRYLYGLKVEPLIKVPVK